MMKNTAYTESGDSNNVEMKQDELKSGEIRTLVVASIVFIPMMFLTLMTFYVCLTWLSKNFAA